MLAREYCDVAEPKIKFKPVILSHREWMEWMAGVSGDGAKQLRAGKLRL
jgi:hypothetical protein